MKFRLLMLVIAASSTSFPIMANQPDINTQTLKLLQIDGLSFKDFDKDGKLSPYEDWRLSPETRAKDLLRHMQLAEKAGLMMHGSAPSMGDEVGFGNTYDQETLKKMIIEDHIVSFITRLNAPPSELAKQNNLLQSIAEQSRLGIPLTMSIDPRHHYVHSVPYKPSPSGFSQWPGPLGFAAINNEKVTQQFADIMRQELRAIGVTQILAPQADLATEPRWSRIDGTFGEDPNIAKNMISAYIIGVQNGHQGLNTESVSAVVKHWVGYGAAEHGFDSHHDYGKYALFRGGKDNDHELETHIYPFTGAFDAQVSGVMPTYSILKNATYQGTKIEPVGAGFNPFLLQNLLRQKYQYQGVIMSDWSITNDCTDECLSGYAEGETMKVHGMPWGVESLTKLERIVKAINAGIDQFGGITDTALLVQAVNENLIPESRLDESVLRILTQKFALGQFERPFVDEKKAATIVGQSKWQLQASQAARASLVMLKNNQKVLPLRKGTRVYLYGIDKTQAEKSGLTVVESLKKAQVVIVRLNTPFEHLHKNFYFGATAHEGKLDFSASHPALKTMRLARQKKKPVIATIYLDRPAILKGVEEHTDVLIANFGITDATLLSALRDNKHFTGKLPFELPSSMKAVETQRSSLPSDSKDPLYPIGFGL